MFPSTDRYQWQPRTNFAHTAQDLETYFHKKQEDLLGGSDAFNGKSLLSRLPTPWGMKDLEKAAARVVLAMERQEVITIFGDYDVDGTTSCAMLKQFFNALNYDVGIYIPDRLQEGYGLNPTGVRKLAEQQTTLIITVDNGISALAGCQEALAHSIDVIITDHHQVPSTLPPAFAILNPKQTDCAFPYDMLAGVGVAFYLMIAIRALRRTQGHADVSLTPFLDFVAIGTIADMAPLDGANHILCKSGLAVLNTNLHEGKRPGLWHLLTLAGWSPEQQVTAGDVGFKIGPRLNAAGRLGNALHSVSVLTMGQGPAVLEASQFLHNENTERQQMERQFTAEALALAQAQEDVDAFVLQQDHWHPGVVGLVASRVLEKYYRPTLVFGLWEGKLKGSGRSTHDFDLFAALDSVREHCLSFGGHFHAVGLTIEPEKLPIITAHLQQQARLLIGDLGKKPQLFLDGHLNLERLDKSLLSRLELFEPYGIKNPRSRWLVGPLQIQHIKRMGKDKSRGHAKVQCLQEGRSYWITAFGLADILENAFESGLEINAVVEMKRGVWQGREYVDLSIVDLVPIVYLGNQQHADVRPWMITTHETDCSSTMVCPQTNG